MKRMGIYQDMICHLDYIFILRQSRKRVVVKFTYARNVPRLLFCVRFAAQRFIFAPEPQNKDKKIQDKRVLVQIQE